MSTPVQSALAALSAGRKDGLDAAFAALLAGEATPAQTGALLMGLERAGVDAEVVAAGARAMRAAMVPVDAGDGLIDVCGTGGDGSHTLNISTAVSFVLAGCGLKVAKHGNRGMSSKSGAGDVLEALGVNLAATPETTARAIGEAGVGFLFAQAHHPAMRHVAAARRELGFRTVFNLLGPLSNPAGAGRQLLGVYAPEKLVVMAEALRLLGAQAAWVIHGDGGLDEAALSGPTRVAALSGGAIETFEITPEDAGLTRAPLEALRGGEPAQNAEALRALLDGAPGAYRDAVILNAACALMVAGAADDLKQAAHHAREAIDRGAARRALDALVAITNEPS